MPRPLASRALTLLLAASLTVSGCLASLLTAPLAAHAAAPIAVDDQYATAGGAVEPPAPGVFANDSEVDDTLMTIRVVTAPTRGTVAVTGPGLFRYEPGGVFRGNDSFTYCIVSTAAPSSCLSNEATVTIQSQKTTAVDDGYSTSVGTPLVVPAPGLFANDLAVSGTMVPLLRPASHGVALRDAGGGFTYTPAPGFHGTDSFDYCIIPQPASTTCLSNTATVTIRVEAGGLTAVDDEYEIDVDAVLTASGATGLLANDVGVSPTDGVMVVTPAQHGAVAGVGIGGAFTYTPSADPAGADSFEYCVTAVPLVPPCLSAPARATIDVHPVVRRVGGADRFAVSAAVSAGTFAPNVPVAYVASGAGFADALSGSAAAGAQHGPVLLTGRDSIPDDVVAELRRLKPAKVVVLGGTASVGTPVEDALKLLTPTVVRYAGADRYAVSARVSQETFAASPPVAYVASGETFPDALSGSAAAGRLGGPVLLVTRDGGPADVATELARLKPSRIVVLGGENTVSAGVLAALRRTAPTTRIGGADRFEVSAAVSRDTFPTGARTVYVASGAVFPDALSGSSAAIASKAPVLLVTATAIPAAVATELDRLKPTRIIVLGGPNTVSEAVSAALKTHLAG